jgi:hypothetical protein
VTFVRYEYNYSWLLFGSNGLEYIFLPFHFNPVFVFASEVNFCRQQMAGSCFLIFQSMSFDWRIETLGIQSYY